MMDAARLGFLQRMVAAGPGGLLRWSARAD